jgi:hypothetical protein
MIGSIIFLLISGATNKLIKEFTAGVVQDDSFSQEAKDTAIRIDERYSTMLDYAMLILIVGMFIALFVAGINVERSPLVLFLVFILLLFAGLVSMVVNNLYYDMLANTPDLEFEQEFPITTTILNNLVYFVIGGIGLFGFGIFLAERAGI